MRLALERFDGAVPVGDPIRSTRSSCSQNRRLLTPASVMPRCQVISNRRSVRQAAQDLEPAVGEIATRDIRSDSSSRSCGMRAS